MRASHNAPSSRIAQGQRTSAFPGLLRRVYLLRRENIGKFAVRKKHSSDRRASAAAKFFFGGIQTPSAKFLGGRDRKVRDNRVDGCCRFGSRAAGWRAGVASCIRSGRGYRVSLLNAPGILQVIQVCHPISGAGRPLGTKRLQARFRAPRKHPPFFPSFSMLRIRKATVFGGCRASRSMASRNCAAATGEIIILQRKQAEGYKRVTILVGIEVHGHAPERGAQRRVCPGRREAASARLFKISGRFGPADHVLLQVLLEFC